MYFGQISYQLVGSGACESLNTKLILKDLEQIVETGSDELTLKELADQFFAPGTLKGQFCSAR
jgi:hypothetical protein